jgi:NADH-quinone oxidoreductase subunit L
MRDMGGMRKRMKTTFWVYLIGALALAGIFPLAGFWSKDEILASELAYLPAVFIILLITAFLTAFYMTRQIMMVFFGEARTPAAEHATESPKVVTIPLIILAVLSAFGGLINLPKWGILGSFEEILGHWLEHTVEEGFLPTFNIGVVIMGSSAALLGIGLGYVLYGRRYQEQLRLPAAKRPEDPIVSFIGPVFVALKNKWWVDELYWLIIVDPYIAVSKWLADVFDWRFWHDWFHDRLIYGGFNRLTRLLSVQVDLGVIDAIANGLGALTQRLAGSARRLQTGFVRNYALAVFLGMVIILGYLIFSS